MALLQSGTRIYGNAKIDTELKIDGNTATINDSTGALTVAGGIGVKGNIYSSGNITALNANLGNLVVANYVTGTLTTGNQPNISNIGTLGNLTVTSNISGGNLSLSGNVTAVDATISGNLIVNGNAIYANTVYLNVKDPIIEQGGDPEGSPLAIDDGKDRGQLLHYYDASPIDAFMGWKNANSEFVFASDASTNNNVVTINQLGNVRAGNFIGYLEGTAATALTVTNNSQPNITSVGTLTDLTVSGNLFATLTTSSQPNVTELGTLTGLRVNGVSNFGNIGNVKILGGASNYVLKTDGLGNLSWTAQSVAVAGSNTQIQFNTDGNLASDANLTYDSATQTLSAPNITANVITVDDITANIATFGDVANLRISGGLPGQGIITDGNGNLSFGSFTSGSTGNNYSVQYSLNGQLAASDNFAFNPSSNTVSVNGNLSLSNSTPVVFNDSTNTNYIAFKAPDAVDTSVTFTLPPNDGQVGNILATDGNGGLYWRGAPSQTMSVRTRSNQNVTIVALFNSILNVVGRAGNVAVPIA